MKSKNNQNDFVRNEKLKLLVHVLISQNDAGGGQVNKTSTLEISVRARTIKTN